MFEKEPKKEYHTIDELDKSLFKTRRCLDSDLVRRYFNYNTKGEVVKYLDDAKGTYKNEIKASKYDQE